MCRGMRWQMTINSPVSRHQENQTALLFTALIFHNSTVWRNSQFYFHKVDKIASGSSYKTLKLWEIHNFIFTSVYNFVKILSNEYRVIAVYSPLQSFKFSQHENLQTFTVHC